MDIKLNVLNGARELFMRYGVKSVTMDDIARELGISKKTLYQSVVNKADLIEGVIEQFLFAEECTISIIQKNAGNAIEEMMMISKHVTQMLRQLKPSTLYDLQKYYKSAWQRIEKHHQDHVFTVVKDNIENGINEGLYRPSLNPDIIAQLYVSKSFIIVDESVFPLRDYDREKLLEEFIDYHIHGIASEKGLKELEKHKNHSRSKNQE